MRFETNSNYEWTTDILMLLLYFNISIIEIRDLIDEYFYWKQNKIKIY